MPISQRISPAIFARRTRAAAAVVFTAAALGLSGCERVKTEKVKVTIATTKPLVTHTGAPLPENVITLLAPAAPFAKRFVPAGEIVRLDLAENNTESLAPQETSGATQKAVEAAWQIKAPAVELAKAVDYLRGHAAGLAGKPGPALEAQKAAGRLREAVAEARSEGREVIAISKGAREGALTIGEGVSVEARANAREACALIDEKLKAGAQPSVLVLLDPPIFDDATPRETVSADSPKPGDSAATPEPPEARITMPGSSTTVIVNPPRDGKPDIALQLPEGARQIGEPVLFATNSARLSESSSQAVAEMVDLIKRSGIQRVILIASADASGSERSNSQLARQRGEVVAAAFLKAGVPVESVLSVGDSLAPGGAPASERKNFRSVCAYTVEPVNTTRL